MTSIYVPSKWDLRFLGLAKHVSSWSRDPSTKVGAVITRADNTIVSLGFNGFPRGVMDSEDRYNDRHVKHRLVVHAEANAILNAREPIYGCTIYINPLFPCNECAKLICQSGIKQVVVFNHETPAHWMSSVSDASLMFNESGVVVRYVDAKHDH